MCPEEDCHILVEMSTILLVGNIVVGIVTIKIIHFAYIIHNVANMPLLQHFTYTPCAYMLLGLIGTVSLRI